MWSAQCRIGGLFYGNAGGGCRGEQCLCVFSVLGLASSLIAVLSLY